MEIKIKNMVCNRCIMVVKQIFEQADIKVRSISLGIVETEAELTGLQIKNVSQNLNELGFEVITNTSYLVDEIKNFTIQFLEISGDKEKFGYFLSASLKLNYSKLSKHFSAEAGISLEKYFIYMKIEQIKELLVKENLSLSEISDKMNYNTTSYLCRQFKAVTGKTPSEYLKSEISVEK